MKTRVLCLVTLLLFVKTVAFGQLFNQVYPISEKPNINWKSNLVGSETILFEANPIVRYSFFNNFIDQQNNNSPWGQAYYLAYKPQLRMYTDNSVPVKMPSYRILAGMQHLHRINEYHFTGFSLESGHYSNGQNGGTFSEQFRDATRESDSVIATINADSNLSAMLNRTDGEFSTDLTELILHYRQNRRINGNNIPERIHSFKAGLTYYHDDFLFIFPFGGYADNLINIYGRSRWMFGYEYIHVFDKFRLNFSENIEYIENAHNFVNPWRLETTFSVFLNNDLGFFASYIYGHDNYNIRFVDSGHQASLGIAWDMYPPPKVR